MFLNSWSLSLFLLSAISLVLLLLAANTAVKVLRSWDPASDSNLQIRLEGQTWLASTLVEYGLLFQIASLLVFVLAADHFCQVIAGAMCATGALTVNSYGVPALVIKIFGVFVYGFWIVLHQLDIRSEKYPLVKIKYSYLLFLLPVVAGDITLQALYIANLEPDIITSCCGVLFSTAPGAGRNLLSSFSPSTILPLFYGTAAVLTGTGVILVRLNKVEQTTDVKLTIRCSNIVYSVLWFWFFLLSLVAVTTIFSSYIYAMPFHHCPFCIIKAEYGHIGIFIYLTLIAGVFFGTNTALTEILRRKEELKDIIAGYQNFAVITATIFLIFYIVLTSFHYIVYQISGGEF